MFISFISALVLWLYAWYLIHRNWYRINRLENRVSELENCACEELTGHWILYDHGLDAKYYQCSICKGFDRGEKGRYCKWCGAKMIEPQESEDKE